MLEFCASFNAINNNLIININMNTSTESKVELGRRSGDLIRLEDQLTKIEQKLDLMNLKSSTKFIDSGFGGQLNEVGLLDLWRVVWRGKWLIIGLTMVFTCLAIAYSLSLPNIYKSEALLVPAEESGGGGLAGLAGQLGGLANLAGVNMGGRRGDKVTLAIEVLRSREFVSKFIKDHDLLVPLMAVKNWDSGRDELVFNEEVYDVSRERWLPDAEPTIQQAYSRFVSKVNISVDKNTGFVLLTCEHHSPTVAKMWVDLLIQEINSEIKLRDVVEAKKSVQYLADQLQKTALADMRNVFYGLIEEQTKVIMFAEVREEYVFKTIDKAIVPEIRAKPQRALICVIGFILGGGIGVLVVFVRYFLERSIQGGVAQQE